MKIKKRIHKGICAVEKCQHKEGLYTVTIEGRDMQMCKEHAIASPDEGGGGKEAYEPPAVVSDEPSSNDNGRILATVEHQGAVELIEALESYEIQTHDDLVTVKGLIDDVKAKNKALEEKKRSATKPLLESLDTIRSWFKPAQEALYQAESLLKRKIIEYDTRVETERAAAIEAMSTVESVEEQEAIMKTLALTEHKPVAGLVRREIWDYKIVDETKVPDLYRSVDHKKIKEAISRGVIQIQGVEIFQVEQLAVRAT